MTMPKILIRKGKIADIPQLIRLYSGVKEISDFAGQKYDKNYFLQYIKPKENIVLVAEKDGKIYGALNAEFEDLAKYTFLVNLVVSKKHRGKGIGGLLIKSLESISKKRKNKQMIGLIFDWNKNMQKVVEHCKYSASHKAIIYVKKL